MPFPTMPDPAADRVREQDRRDLQVACSGARNNEDANDARLVVLVYRGGITAQRNRVLGLGLGFMALAETYEIEGDPMTPEQRAAAGWP